jgi:Gas vesicle synthesis protein GvpO
VPIEEFRLEEFRRAAATHARGPGRAGGRGAARQSAQPGTEGVTGVRRTEDGWSVFIDVVGFDGILASTGVLATYRVDLDAHADLISCERTRRYSRGATDPQ